MFHVLAHVRSSAPAGLYDPTWIAFVARHARAVDRTLAEDVAALEAAQLSHDALAELQLLAWLFESTERTEAAVDARLDELGPDEVDDPGILRLLQRSAHRPVIELLRVAAELEIDTVRALPPPKTRGSVEELARVSVAAPHLARCVVEHVRPLRLRGRVLRRRIWVGVADDELGPTAEHVAWQAAHEATVAEVSERARLSYLPLEQCALHLLSTRAARAGLAESHARWLAHFGALPPFARADLDPASIVVIDQALGG